MYQSTHCCLEYTEPSAYGIEEALPFDASLWRERFPHLNIAGPVILPLAEPAERATTMSILSDLVALFGIREIAVPEAFRASNPEFDRLHKRSSDKSSSSNRSRRKP